MPLTHDQKVLVRSLAIGGGMLSMVAGLFMLYWFLKLKNRSFRHQLVMLLVASDALKACFEVIYPAKNLLNDKTTADTLCTVLGFLNNVCLESADMAVLIIAVHTALCIFKPPSGGVTSERAGLYPYRYAVYAIWPSFGILMASLAFLNKNQAYINATSWCYLPVRPFYWRIALSWAPRYLILAFIFILYLSIFIYVKRKFNSFTKAIAMTIEDESSGLGMSSIDQPVHFRSEPMDLDMHLLSSPLQSPGTSPTRPALMHRSSSQDCRPTLVFLNSDDRFPFQLRRESILTISEQDMPRKREQTIEGDKAESPTTDAPTNPSAKPRIVSRRPTMLSLAKTMHLRTKDLGSGNVTPTALFSPPQPVIPKPLDPLSQERARIVKQLKHLFIFPIVYFLMWIIPFAFHLSQYHEEFVAHPIVPLAAIASFMIPLHGFIDVLIYARNEKPWRSWRFSHGRKRVTSVAFDKKDEKSLAMTNAEPIQHIDVVAQRQQQEIIEAQERKLKRQSQLQSASMVSGKPDWWDLELEQQRLSHEDDR